MRAVFLSLFLGLVFVGAAFAETAPVLASKNYVDIQADSVPIGRPDASVPSNRVLLWVEE